MLDIPDEVWNKVIADGNAAWLDELPSVVESLAQECEPTAQPRPPLDHRRLLRQDRADYNAEPTTNDLDARSFAAPGAVAFVLVSDAP
jgi:hypothetical protein